MEIQVCSNEGSHPFPRGDNYEMVKMDWYISESSFRESPDQFQANLEKGILGVGDPRFFK